MVEAGEVGAATSMLLVCSRGGGYRNVQRSLSHPCTTRHCYWLQASGRAEGNLFWSYRLGLYFQNSSRHDCSPTAQSSSLLGSSSFRSSKAHPTCIPPVSHEACYITKTTNCFVSPNCPWEKAKLQQVFYCSLQPEDYA